VCQNGGCFGWKETIPPENKKPTFVNLNIHLPSIYFQEQEAQQEAQQEALEEPQVR